MLRHSLAAYLLSPTLALAGTSLTIENPGADRCGSVTTFIAPESMRGNWTLDAGDGKKLPLQIDADGTATYIEPLLKKGEKKSYTAAPATNLPDALIANQEGDRLHVSLADGNRPIFSYQMAASQVPAGVAEHFRHGAHLHPLHTPSGRIVTGDYPPDHRWHRGVWFAWTKTDFEGRHPDFWNMGKDKGGKLTGEVRFKKLEASWNGPVHAGFKSLHQHLDHTSGAEKVVLEETWQVRAYVPDNAKQTWFLFDLTSTQTLAGSTPLVLPAFHYGGLGLRGPSAWDAPEAVTMLTSEGADRKAGDGKPARWVWFGGTVDGQTAGIAVLIHPDNFRFPQPLRLNPGNPQICVAPSKGGDWKIEPGNPYVSKYRIVAMDGTADAKVIEALWHDYAEKVTATVDTP